MNKPGLIPSYEMQPLDTGFIYDAKANEQNGDLIMMAPKALNFKIINLSRPWRKIGFRNFNVMILDVNSPLCWLSSCSINPDKEANMGALSADISYGFRHFPNEEIDELIWFMQAYQTHLKKEFETARLAHGFLTQYNYRDTKFLWELKHDTPEYLHRTVYRAYRIRMIGLFEKTYLLDIVADLQENWYYRKKKIYKV